MREILFRGKRIDNGEWVEGYLIHDKHDGLYRIVIKLEYSTGTYIVTGFAPRVNVKTIGQYTGLTDKNGKRIFEGDIIKTDNGKRSAVSVVKYGEYKPKMFYELLRIYNGWQPKEPCFGFFCNSDKEQFIIAKSPFIEVIGNIHDSKLEDFVNGG